MSKKEKLAYLQLNDADCFLTLPRAAPAVQLRQLVDGDISDQSDVTVRWNLVQVVRRLNFRVREEVSPEQEPPRSPTIAVACPFIEHSGEGSRVPAGVSVRFFVGKLGARGYAPSTDRDADVRTLQCDAAERRVHLLYGSDESLSSTYPRCCSVDRNSAEGREKLLQFSFLCEFIRLKL